MESLVKEESKLDKKLEGLLDQFEREVEPYDRLSSISMFATPVGVVISIFIPMVIMQFVVQTNPYVAVAYGFNSILDYRRYISHNKSYKIIDILRGPQKA